MAAYQKMILASGMLVFGSINTITTKTADMVNVTGRPNYPPHPYSHPYVQGVGMFLGEFSCLIVFYLIKLIKFIKQRANARDYVISRSNPTNTESNSNSCNPFLYLLPALCDMCATSTVYFGLTFTYASSFQMLRGSVIIFTSLFSIIFLNRKIQYHMWIGIFLVMIGLTIVGVSDVIFSNHENTNIHDIIMGDVMIILAQIITGIQMCIEEKFSTGNVHPLQIVGWEGFWGTLILSSLLYPLSHFKVGPRIAPNTPMHTLEDVTDAIYQMKNNYVIIIATIGNMSSIALFNFFGISVTKHISATTRMVLDSMRTIVIWIYSIGVGWQNFVPTQVIGFIFLLTGMAWYNKLLLPKCLNSNTNYDILSNSDFNDEDILIAVDDDDEFLENLSSESLSSSNGSNNDDESNKGDEDDSIIE